MMIYIFLLTMTLCLSKVTIHSSSNNFPIEMRLEWRLGKISACVAWIDSFLCYGDVRRSEERRHKYFMAT